MMMEISTTMPGTSATMLQWLLPRVALSSLFALLAVFAFFESIYLRDQASFFGAALGAAGANAPTGTVASGNVRHEILVWMWAFRAFALALGFFCIAIFVRK
jgi:hypothetical protein